MKEEEVVVEVQGRANWTNQKWLIVGELNSRADAILALLVQYLINEP